MEPTKIAKAVEAYLQSAVGAKLPFGNVQDYIDQLKVDPNWTADEIIEVQTRVIRELMRRLGIGD